MESNLWLVCPKPVPAARWRLVCFPYAGGGAPVFRQWADHLPSEIELSVVQLPGRGARINEAPFDQVEPLVGSLADAVTDRLSPPFAFYGHSLGALIAFELARELRARGGLPPSRLLVAGRRAPHWPPLDPPLHTLPDSALLAELRRLNGTPAELLANRELMQLMLPTLRADFAVGETYRYRPAPPLDCPMAAFGGADDSRLNRDQLEAWREHTAAEFSLHILPGDHFFLHSAQPALLAIIADQLAAKGA